MNGETTDSQCQSNEREVEGPEEPENPRRSKGPQEPEDEMPIVRFVEQIKFSPPAFIQRYNKVAEVLADPKYNSKIQKVSTCISCVFIIISL